MKLCGVFAFRSTPKTLLGRFANAYEPLLEQYVGRPVILDVADPINPNNRMSATMLGCSVQAL